MKWQLSVSVNKCCILNVSMGLQQWHLYKWRLFTHSWVCSWLGCSCYKGSVPAGTIQLQGCQLSRFSRKLPEFEAHFMRLRIFDKTPEFRTHRHILRQNSTDLKSQHKMCRLVHFQSGKSQKKHAECWLIGIGTVLIIATLITPQPTNRSYPSYGLKVNKNGGSSNCTKAKNVYNMNRSIKLNTDIISPH